MTLDLASVGCDRSQIGTVLGVGYIEVSSRTEGHRQMSDEVPGYARLEDINGGVHIEFKYGFLFLARKA